LPIQVCCSPGYECSSRSAPFGRRELGFRCAGGDKTRRRIMPRLVCWIALGFLSLSLASESRAQALPRQSAATSESPEPLRPGDVVRLRIWREPDLSGDFHVDESGLVVLPKLGPVSVGVISRDSLRRSLLAAYSTYLKNPSIEVVLLRRVNVLGAVRNPGLYPVDPTMTIADALALAGGPTPEGKRDRVDLVRGGDRLKVRLDPATRLGDTPIRSGDQLFVPERSWLSRNPGLVIGTLTAVTALVVRIGLHRR
jgi:protein involved in polysaccharide export with SLBB domain